jgi:hypothetical protein
MPTGALEIRRSVLRVVSASKRGKSAAEIVSSVAAAQRVDSDAVRREVLNLIESGELTLGTDLRLRPACANKRHDLVDHTAG